MPAEDHFINRGLLKVKVNDYLRRELRRAGYAGVDLQKTPLGMRVVVYASRPGMVIGRRGTTVRELTETLEHDFGLEAPQIEVSEVEVPELNGAIMAERLAQRLERGDHFRRAAYGVLRRIVGAGAKGVEISIAGKLTSRRARYQKFRSGFVAKTGEPIRTAVSHGIAYAIMKPGILGVQVRIMLPDAVAPDQPIIMHREVELPPVPAPEAVEASEVEVIEEELPIEEAPPIDEFIEEGGEPSPATETPSEPELEPIPEPEPEDVPPLEKKPEPEKPKPKPKKKPKAAPAKKKAPEKPKPKAKKKVEEKPKAKPKKAKVEEKPKAKKKKVEAKPKTKAKSKATTKTTKKAAEKPKAKTKKDSAKPKAKKSETTAGKEKAGKSSKSSSNK
ncbi:MAG: 30S ribosomal protein S3 [Candidatus Hermodarchaeota archaeon]